MDAAGRLRRAHLVDRPVAVVGPDEHEMHVGQLARRCEQMIDSLAGSDASRVERDRCGLWTRALRAARRDPRHRIGIRKSVAAHAHAVDAHAAVPDVPGLALGADYDGRRRRDPA